MGSCELGLVTGSILFSQLGSGFWVYEWNLVCCFDIRGDAKYIEVLGFEYSKPG